MSEKLPALIQTTDLTVSDLTKVNRFVENGLPGIADITDQQIHKMFDLYLHGSTYTQISSILEVKKIYVLYLAHKSGWYETKQEYLAELQEKIKTRIIDAKLNNHDFMLTAVHAWKKKILSKLNKYLATGDDRHMEDIDLKEMAHLMKAIDMVNELDNTGKNPQGKTPLVGLNMGNGVVVEKTGDNSISITPKTDSPIGDILQQYADDRRQKEKVTIGDVSDITNKKGANNEGK